MELQKQVTKWVTPTEKRQSKWFYCFYRSFMVDKSSSPTPKWQCLTAWSEALTLSAVGNDDRMLRNKFVVCKCPGPRTLLIVKCPASGTHLKTNARGLPGGGCSRLELTRTLVKPLLPQPKKNMNHKSWIFSVRKKSARYPVHSSLLLS